MSDRRRGSLAERWIRLLVRLQPPSFRARHGEEYASFLRRQRAEVRYRGGLGVLRFWTEATAGALRVSLSGHSRALMREVVPAGRRLLRAPAFTVGVSATLGLAIGVVALIWTVVAGTIFAALPYATGERIALIRNDVPAMNWRDLPVGRWVYQPLEESDDTPFEAVTATLQSRMTLRVEERPTTVQGLAATSDFFRVFGITPSLGSAFSQEEDRPGSDRVAVLTHGLWLRAFGADPGAVGRAIDVEGIRRQVLGVLPEGVRLPERAELLVPLAPDRTLRPPVGDHSHTLYGLLRPGITFRQAREQVAAFGGFLDESRPEIDLARFGYRLHAAPLGDALTRDLRSTLGLLGATAALLFLLACANVSNLSLARTEARRGERVIRLSLGAGPGDLARSAGVEAALVAGLGALLGFGVLHLGLQGLAWLPVGTIPWHASIPEFAGAAGVAPYGATGGGLALASTLVVLTVPAAVALLLAGVAAVSQAAHADPARAFRADARAGSDRAPLRSGLVASQAFFATVLLCGAGLLGRSLLAMSAVDPGFESHSVLAVEMQLPSGEYGDPGAMTRFVTELVPEIRAIPGVRAVGVSTAIPMSGRFDPWAIQVEGQDPDAEGGFLPDAYPQVVTSGYFAALGIPLWEGRPANDDTRVGEAVVNRAFVQEVFDGGDAIGRRISYFGGEWVPIVGVVEDVRMNRLTEAPTPHVYYSFGAWADFLERSQEVDAAENLGLALLIGSSVDEGALAASVRDRIAGAAPSVPVVAVRTLASIVRDSRATATLTVLVVGLIAVAGLLLGAIGTYAVIAHSVAARTREFGIRLALGSSPRGLITLTTRSGLRPVLAGLLGGVLAAVAGAGLISSQLFGIQRTDPVTYLAVATLLILVGTLATLGPALRAARTDPLTSIRR